MTTEHTIIESEEVLRSPRVRVSELAALATPESEAVECHLVDLSPDGALVQTPDPLEIGTPVSLDVTLPAGRRSKRLVLSGTICRGDGRGMGIHFDDLPHEIRDFLAEFTYNRILRFW